MLTEPEHAHNAAINSRPLATEPLHASLYQISPLFVFAFLISNRLGICGGEESGLGHPLVGFVRFS